MSVKMIARATALAALLTVAYIGAPAAQGSMSPDQCFARFTDLDGDGDKQLSSTEAGQYIRGDTNADGAVSNDEFMQACEQGLFDAMTPN